MTWFDPAAVALAFIVILPAELPDKTFLATLVLSTRYRRLPVWLGVGAAFAVQSAIAVTAGGLLSLLPTRLVLGITFLLFAAGSVLLLVTGWRAREHDEDEAPHDTTQTSSSWRIAAISFGVLFTAEWGDLSQLVTAGLAAQTASPVSVFVGAWCALLVVSGVAVLAGTWLRERIALWKIRIASGLILAALATWTAVEWISAG